VEVGNRDAGLSSMFTHRGSSVEIKARCVAVNSLIGLCIKSKVSSMVIEIEMLEILKTNDQAWKTVVEWVTDTVVDNSVILLKADSSRRCKAPK
jgi:hypothetical protein